MFSLKKWHYKDHPDTCYCCDWKSRAAYAQSFALWQQATIEFTCHDHSIIACSRHIYVWCCSSRTSRSWWITQSTQHHRRGCNNIPSFLQRTAPIARSLYEGWTPHDLHILVTAPFCCDRKSRAACAQSFAPWQQATIEFTCHDHSVIACSRHIYVWCILYPTAENKFCSAEMFAVCISVNIHLALSFYFLFILLSVFRDKRFLTSTWLKLLHIVIKYCVPNKPFHCHCVCFNSLTVWTNFRTAVYCRRFVSTGHPFLALVLSSLA